MGRIETIQIPSELHPTGGTLLKIMWDDKEPPKEYIWAKGEDDYWIWDGKKWIPYEFEQLKNKGCYQKNCGCVSQEEMAVKFNKFKKDVLAAVSRMTKTQDAIDVADIRAQLSELKVVIHQLEEFEHYYTKTEIDANFYDKTAVDQKTSELNDLTNVINGSVTSLSRRIVGMESSVSDMLSTLNVLSNIDHSQFIMATDVPDEDYDVDPIDPGEQQHIDLDGYATEQYVDQAVARIVNSAPEALDTLKELSDALNNDSNFATHVMTMLSKKANITDLPEQYDDTQIVARIEALENNPATEESVLTRISALENNPAVTSNVVDRIETLEGKPFDQYMTNADGTLIAEDLVDLDSRMTVLENNTVRTGALEEYIQ